MLFYIDFVIHRLLICCFPLIAVVSLNVLNDEFSVELNL